MIASTDAMVARTQSSATKPFSVEASKSAGSTSTFSLQPYAVFRRLIHLWRSICYTDKDEF
ncbi:hypothetical protein, partial [Laceyella tengchongensis]|uniref:hypothetical protein n=1 Tax=Laceyella tengchongensis TaxID=574699 RepID=UPI001E2FBE44